MKITCPKCNHEFSSNPIIEITSGWKGKGNTEIYKGIDEDFIIVEYIKDKNTREVKKITHTVKKEDFNRMAKIIGKLSINEIIKCYDISKKLGYNNWSELWKVRKIYFRIYYYPLKVLEALGMIEYGSRTTERLK